MNRKQTVITTLIFLASFIMFIYFCNKNSAIYYDEQNYRSISLDILHHGIFGISLDLRTYLYPLIVAILSIFTDGRIEHIKIFVSILQFSVFLFTVFFIGKTAKRYFSSDTTYYVILIFGALNPYLIQSTTLMLTDILAACLLMISAILLIDSDLNKLRNGLIMSTLLYCAVMIRPSSAIFLPVFLALAAYRYFRFKEFKLPKFMISGVLCLVIFLPQLYNNVHNFNHFTPLIHQSLYHDQSEWAAQYLKYSTVIEKSEIPQLYYYSPFYHEGQKVALTSLIFTNPFQFITVFSAHVFGLFDWGYVNTFIANLKDKSKLLFSLLLYSFWFIMIWGFVYSLRIKNKLALPLLFAAGVYVLFMGTTAVESRFGYPIYFFILPFAGVGLQQIITQIKSRKTSKIIYIFSLFIIILSLSLYISFIIDEQTHRIHWF